MNRDNSSPGFGQMSMRNLYGMAGHSKSVGANLKEDKTSECEQIEQQIEIEILHQKNKDLQACLKLAYDDMEDRHTISQYAKLIIEASPKTINSNYVIRLQSQLHKSLHKMGMLQNQMDLAKSQADAIIKKLQLKLARQMDANLLTEQTTFQDMMDMDQEMRKLQERHTSEIRKYQTTISELEDKLERAEQKARLHSNRSEVRVADNAVGIEKRSDENEYLRQKLQQKDLMIENLMARLARHEAAQAQSSRKKDKALDLDGGTVKLTQMPRRLSSHAGTA